LSSPHRIEEESDDFAIVQAMAESSTTENHFSSRGGRRFFQRGSSGSGRGLHLPGSDQKSSITNKWYALTTKMSFQRRRKKNAAKEDTNTATVAVNGGVEASNNDGDVNVHNND
jgi:hypothetical protein